MSHQNPNNFDALKNELSHLDVWLGRICFIGFAVLAGLVIVGFTWITDKAFSYFIFLYQAHWWATLFWMPISTACIVWLTRRYFEGAAGSGIQNVIAVQEAAMPVGKIKNLISLKLAVGKLFLTTWGILAGLSMGREGPSVQVAAGIMLSARRWLPRGARINREALIVAGGAAGIAAAFNTPLGGIVFAMEELMIKPNHRLHGLIMAAIVTGGLISLSAFGNDSYFGVIHVKEFGWPVLLPALLVAISCGLLGGLFSKLLLISIIGTSNDWFSQQKRKHPVWFAAGCGLAVAIIGISTKGDIFGSGYAQTKDAVEHGGDSSSLFVLLKFCATWLTTWSGVPGGIFSPAMAIGGAIGGFIASILNYVNPPTLIAIGMAGFLAAMTQAPITSFIIVMEMIDGHSLVLSLMVCALTSTAVSRLISAPFYATLSKVLVDKCRSTITKQPIS
jgi:H+/Cl- antiporter ClcA